MTRLDNDLISRKDLMEELDKDGWQHPASVIKIITNASTIEADSVAWRYKLTLKSNWQYSSNYPTGCEDCCAEIIEPLYTSPQKREWRQLTDDEIFECTEAGQSISQKLISAIQAKLKEVNHG